MTTSPPDLEARVTTVAEFLEMLRIIHQRSGRTANHIAEVAAIPRSTAYRYVSPQNTVLPSKPEYLERLLRVCKLQPRDIKRVMRVWEQLASTSKPEPSGPQENSTPPHRSSTRHEHPR